ncbi:MAG: hydrogenase formation protein HypD [Dissulfurimicrobium sp.]|uniref:hydrogenase formation protein HypD n=1 Tax=Dissulfurimicrobium TaxID=1769732 RepID=UPI001EDB0238|nr:hydrogenase formation protein HypD [Dissulfurimicrobium hydrothermale]UKL13588.1 hydrogenase formation protein HypD [Dissulfurimicrobium hydrothermale]
MGQSEDISDPDLIKDLALRLKGLVKRPMKFMEVCGTHTVSISRSGLRSIIPKEIELISGPGCPVCVTAQGDIDAFIETAKIPGITVTTFGDLLKVPGSSDSLAGRRAKGAQVDVVYSPVDALQLARKDRSREVVFLAVGFETTIPCIAATIKDAARDGTGNFSILPALKLMPPALEALLETDIGIDGLICPGHVSAVIGAAAYKPIAEGFGMPCVVAGFEPAEILFALILLARQVNAGRAEVENAYPRAVSWEGNGKALGIMNEVFLQCDTEWRGLGAIRQSGLALKPEYNKFDAKYRFGIETRHTPEPKGCLCGDIIKGLDIPSNCPFFASICTPVSPVGPCMVSSEGACAAYFRYETGVI